VAWIYLGQDYHGISFSVRVCESLYCDFGLNIFTPAVLKYSLYRRNSELFNLGKIILLDVYLSFLNGSFVLFWHGLNFAEYLRPE
jgi:hypothetical protein